MDASEITPSSLSGALRELFDNNLESPTMNIASHAADAMHENDPECKELLTLAYRTCLVALISSPRLFFNISFNFGLIAGILLAERKRTLIDLERLIK